MILSYIHLFQNGRRVGVEYDCTNVRVRIRNHGDKMDLKIMLLLQGTEEFQQWVAFVQSDLFPRLTKAQMDAGEAQLWESGGMTGKALNPE